MFIFNFSIQVYLYSAFYDTIVAEQLYRKLSFYNIFIYCRNLIYLIYGKIWLFCMLSEGWHPLRSSEGLASSLLRCLVISDHLYEELTVFRRI